MNYYVIGKWPTVRTPIHIGKSSIGWKFLFHRVSAWENYIDDKPLNTAKQWYSFLRDNESVIYILNEEDEIIEAECDCDVCECAKALRDKIEMIIFPF